MEGTLSWQEEALSPALGKSEHARVLWFLEYLTLPSAQ